MISLVLGSDATVSGTVSNSRSLAMDPPVLTLPFPFVVVMLTGVAGVGRTRMIDSEDATRENVCRFVVFEILVLGVVDVTLLLRLQAYSSG